MTFGQPYAPASPQQRQRERTRRLAAMARGVAAAPKPSISMGGTTSGPAPKPESKRNPVLLEMANGRPCLLLVPGCCNHHTDTTVAAHSNLAIHGKAKGRKADDCYTVAACHACHTWLDQGPASAEQKKAQFLAGHALQVWAWQNIAAASDEPARFRNAARWALDALGVTR